MREKFLGLVELNEMFNNLKTMINIYFIIFLIRRMVFYLASIGKVIMNRFLTSHEHEIYQTTGGMLYKVIFTCLSLFILKDIYQF
jgi:hypothetical protein